MPNSGHGYNKRIAEAAGVSNAFFSQVLSDKRQLSSEQASLISDFLGLNEVQSEYLLTLVELDRAGIQTLRNQLKKRMRRLKESAQMIFSRFVSISEVAEKDRPIYYSDWIFIAIQQLTAIPGLNSEFEISKKLDLPLKKVREVISFLVSIGLCIEKKGVLKIGPARIHLASDSPWIKQHHSNWRARAMENFVHTGTSEKLHYSAPMTLSKADCEKVRGQIVALIESVAKVVDPSPSEELMCLNIDWFSVGK